MNGDFPFHNVLLYFSNTGANIFLFQIKIKAEFFACFGHLKLLGLFKHSFETSSVSLSNF